jgi:thiol-disulfide isomerase/thioredoxin
MRAKNVLLLITFLCGVAISSSSFAQKSTLDGEKYGYCMVTGGGAPTGFAKFDINSPNEFTILAPKPDDIYFMGADFGPDRTWYATTWDGGLYTVDTISGVHTLLGNLGQAILGFTYSIAHETFYACTGGTFYTVDIATTTLEEVGPMGNAGNMIGLGSDNRGNIYGVDTNDDNLYKIDPITGIATAVGPSGFDFDYNQNCTFSKDTDQMLHAGFWVNPSVHGGLYSYDVETGAATLEGAFPQTQEVTSFAVPWSIPAHGSIHGIVTDEVSGDPINSATIILESVSGDGSFIQCNTENDGLYNFDIVLPGEYTITAVHGNYSTTIVEDITINADDNQEINIEMTIGEYTATFNVFLESNNEPVAGASVNFLSQTLETNSNGEVSFENVSSGSFPFIVDYDGYFQGFGTVEVTDENVLTDVYLYDLIYTERSYVILEEATATWCGPCANLAPTLDQLIEDGLPTTMIAYHGNDPYSSTAGDSRIGYYGITAYPTMIFDGETYNGAQSYASLEAHIMSLMDIETPVSVEFTEVILDGNEVSGEIKVENLGPINSDDIVLHIVLTESHIPEVWQSNDELNHVLRSMIPDQQGTPIDVQEVSAKNIEFTASLEDVLNIDNCELVCFVQDAFTKEILNGNHFPLNTIGVKDISNEAINIYPIPAKDVIHYSSNNNLDSFEIYNISGQVLIQDNISNQNGQINISMLQEGSYFIKFLDKNQNTIIERFSK